MYYIIGDIHGCINNLRGLMEKLKKKINMDDLLIFVGDYIDRGPSSFDVIDYLLAISKKYNCVFLKGNHESMFLHFLRGDDIKAMYFYNGGDKTVESYTRSTGRFAVPESHFNFLKSLCYFYEGEDFIAVHAGLNPKIYSIENQDREDLIWIREDFFRNPRRWEKTIIFGHTPTLHLTGGMYAVYKDYEKNIIGIDTGAVYGGVLTAFRWPDEAEFQV